MRDQERPRKAGKRFRTIDGLFAIAVTAVGLAVLGVWLARWASRIPSPRSNWLDRLGRLLAVAWILLAIGFLIGC